MCQNEYLWSKGLRYPSLRRGFLHRVISVISVVLREASHTISVSSGEPVLMESETV